MKVSLGPEGSSTRFGKGKLTFVEAMELIGADSELEQALRSSKNMGSSAYFKVRTGKYLLIKGLGHITTLKPADYDDVGENFRYALSL